MSIKKALARKAVRSTAKHTAHGTASKLSREPLRATTLLGLGGLLGGLAGWLLALGGLLGGLAGWLLARGGASSSTAG